MTVGPGIIVAALLVVLLGFGFLLIRRLTVTCGVDEILVLTGGSHQDPEGSLRSYRVVLKGRTLRMPFREKVYRLSTRSMSVGIRPDGVVTKDRVRMTVLATASISLSRHERWVHNAIQCFLTVKPDMIKPLARKEIEKTLKQVVLSRMEDEIHRNPRAFNNEAQRIVARELSRLGLDVHLDKLQVL